MNDSHQLILLYHFFHPDDVISSRLFSDVAEEFAADGYRVIAMPAARLFENGIRLPKREQWKSVLIERVWRPGLKQGSNRGRLLNAMIMLIQWTLRAAFYRRTSNETVVIGTDPILSILVAIPWRLFRPRSRIVHWCHDLYPEAAFADGLINEATWYTRLLQNLMRLAYRRCDVILDLGQCMQERLKLAAKLPVAQSHRFQTVTPWALVEPNQIPDADLATRHKLFGDSKLALLYSGNLGRAHEFELFVELAQATQQESIAVCFAGRGPRLSALKETSGRLNLPNIRFADFASEQELENRLAAGDVHLVSLRPDWTGTVVPSKFFGSLAIGRPVLFVGSPDCAIARWIEQHKIGWHLHAKNVHQVAEQLRELACHFQNRLALNNHCQSVYREHFSREHQLQRLKELL